MEAVLFIGVQASGKSSFFRDKFFHTHVRLNLDMLRTRHRESVLLRACIEGKARFVVDNTNPTRDFRWRNEDAHRNALNAHCYWALRGQGKSVSEATNAVSGLSVPQKNELLFGVSHVNFNDLPRWQRRGVGLYWETYEVRGLVRGM